jgi:hypothetical protein
MNILKEKMDAQDTILDDITREQLTEVWTRWENGPHPIAKKYDQLETWRKEKMRSSPKKLERWDIFSHK